MTFGIILLIGAALRYLAHLMMRALFAITIKMLIGLNPWYLGLIIHETQLKLGGVYVSVMQYFNHFGYR
jgi:hypothetical protein